MTATSTTLTRYYKALDQTLTDTIALNELNLSIFGVPFSDTDRKLIEDSRSEIRHRQKLAEALTKLASSMVELTGSKAPEDVSTAATALGNELVSVKALPSGSPVPEGVGSAGKFLLQIAQQREEKKAAQAMDSTLTALVELFEKEKPVYDSIDRQRVMQARLLAASLIKKQVVDPTPLLRPALKPFGLSAVTPDAQLQATLLSLAESRLQRSAAELSDREADASEAMLKALIEMSARVHRLATSKAMPERGNPISLEVVDSWLASLK